MFQMMLDYNFLIPANLCSSKSIHQKRGIGAAMLQCDPIEIPNNLHPISYASNTLSETELNFYNIE